MPFYTPGTTNLVKNGGGETNTTYTFLAGGGVVTITSDATYFKFGSKCFKVVIDGATALQGLGMEDTGGTKIPVSAGTTYSLSAWVRGTSGAESLQFAINWYNAADALISTTTGSNFTASASEMVRQTLTATAPALADRAQIRVRASGTSAYTFYVDGVQLEVQPLATPYVETDGATASRSGGKFGSGHFYAPLTGR